MLELPKKMLVCPGFTFVLHIHTVMVEAEVLKIVEIINENEDDEPSKKTFLRSQ